MHSDHFNGINSFVVKGFSDHYLEVKESETYKTLVTVEEVKLPGLAFNLDGLKLPAGIFGQSKTICKVDLSRYNDHIKVFMETFNQSAGQEAFFPSFQIFNVDNEYHLLKDVTNLIMGNYSKLYTSDVEFTY